MPVRPITHPSPDALKAFGLGKLDDTSASVLMNHLDQCADCCKVVASQSGDDFLERFRQAHALNSTPAPAKSLAGISPDAKLPGRPTALHNLPPELAEHPQYEVLRELGQGGMGVVYLAKNKLMDRLEVLKVVNKALLDRPGSVERFLREIRSAAKLSHANVVGAYSALQLGDVLAFAMEYVEGEDLAVLVKSRGPLPVAHACYYIQQAALGLQHAFEKNMVHRDIKPQNLILAREGKKHLVKILDFGLAKVTREKVEDTGLTGEGKMLGTPDYIAPEQTLDAASADIRADIYSLGCTLYYLLSGRPPFSATSLGAILLAHQMQEAKLLNLVRPEVPEELAAVVRKMMAKEPARRYQTPAEVARTLTAFIKPGAKGGTAPKSSSDLSVGEPEAAPRRASVTLASSAAALASPTEDRPASPESPKSAGVNERRSASVIARSPFDDLEDTTAPTSAAKKAKSRRTVAIALALALFVPLGIWLAVVMLRVETANGTLVVEMNDNEVEARIKNGKLILSGPDGKIRYTLTAKDRSKKLEAGPYKIRVEGADGLVLDTPEFTLKKGGEVRVRVTMAAKDVVKNTPASLAGDRKAAEYVLSIGGTVRVNEEERDIKDVADLPREMFRLTYIGLRLNPKVNDMGLAACKGCKNLTFLNLNDTPVGDAGLTHFTDCKNLTVLWLWGTQVSDVGLASFKDCKNLTLLALADTKISDAGLAHFKDCKNLISLYLWNTQVGDASLPHLKDCQNLMELSLGGTKVTAAGIEELKTALPKCRIN